MVLKLSSAKYPLIRTLVLLPNSSVTANDRSNMSSSELGSKIKEIKKLLKNLFSKIVTNSADFSKLCEFTLNEYLHNQNFFVTTCAHFVNHIEHVVHNAGIAETTAGAAQVMFGVTGMLGIGLASFTFGWSLDLTVASVGLGVASGAASLATSLIKDVKIKADEQTIKLTLARFEIQEREVVSLFSSLHEEMEQLRELMKGDSTYTLGYNVLCDGYQFVETIKVINFTKGVAVSRPHISLTCPVMDWRGVTCRDLEAV